MKNNKESELEKTTRLLAAACEFLFEEDFGWDDMDTMYPEQAKWYEEYLADLKK